MVDVLTWAAWTLTLAGGLLLAGALLNEGFPRTLFKGLAIAFGGAIAMGAVTLFANLGFTAGALL